MEIEELTRYKKIREWHPRDDRHSLFWSIKYPDHRFYKGSWGPELLHFVNDGPHRGPVGKIHCTFARYNHIQRWFIDNMFPA